MSFYGNIKRIGSQSFQFDRVYASRCEMDDALNSDNGDGVYPGRYVLIEYGERYSKNGTSIIENSAYRASYDNDFNTYGNVYDSTVWQKIYTKATNSNRAGEKYIMVAELNALAPQLDLVVDTPATLIKANEGEAEGIQEIYYGEHNAKLNKVKQIEYHVPYFDAVRDTELKFDTDKFEPV